MARLILENGDGPRDTLLSDVCRLGRDKGNEVPISDPGMSRRHCRIFREGDDYILEDLKSANGTFCNDERIDRIKLNDGDQVRVGQTSFRFRAGDQGAVEAEEISLEDPAAAGDAPFEIGFCAGERSGERVKLVGERITFGRKSSNTVVLKDAKVSGVHAEIALEDGRPVLRDLGSTNGTFLEGKRIDEIVLDHGDKVTLGENEFVLADCSKGKTDELMAVMGDGSQTMIAMPEVRVVKDVKKAKRSPLATIGLVLVVLALAAAGWFYWQVQKGSAEVLTAPPPTGNLLAERWSFEPSDDEPDPASHWQFLRGSLSIKTGGARSGMNALQARPGEEAAVAGLTEPLRISGRRYTVSAWIKSSAEAVGLVQAVFSSDADQLYEVVMPVGSSSGSVWSEVRADLIPPTGATHVALGLTAAGNSGSVLFDDLGIQDVGVARAQPVVVNQFEFERAGEQILVRRGSELLRIGALAFEAAEAEAQLANRFLAGEQVLLPRGLRCGYASRFHNDARTATWKVEWRDLDSSAIGVSLTLDLVAALLEQPVGVMRGAALEPYRSSFQANDVSGLVLGVGVTRIRINFTPAVRLEGNLEEARFRLKLLPPVSAGALAIATQVDFVEEKARAAELATDAKASQAAGRLGEALGILDQITNQFPFDEAILVEADRRRNEIQAERDRLEGAMKATVERARFLKSPAAYAEAETEAKASAAAFEGIQTADTFRALAAELAAERAIIVQSERERQAEFLLQRIETLLAQDPPQRRAAQEIADYLTRTQPGSEPAVRASERLRSSDGS